MASARRPTTARTISGAVPGSVRSVNELREAASACRMCPLWRDATQTVFGEGTQRSRIMLVGEQPGDQEDREGRPFVGPAGRLLDKALAEAGIDRSRVYVTNAVKHFKFLLRGKRRLHKTPGQLEIAACHPWLEAEIRSIQPRLVVAMGGTAARAVMGKVTAIEANRGHVIAAADVDLGTDVLITVHPSYVLRVPSEDRAKVYRRFLADLRLMQPYVARTTVRSRRRAASQATSERRA